MALSKCNRCGGVAEFRGTAFIDGKVFQRWICLCGNTEDRPVSPHGYDLDDPRAVKTMLLNQDYGKRIGLYR